MSDVVKSDFQIMDEADSLQIIEADASLKAALAYEVRGKPTLSYTGIQWIVQKMAVSGQPLALEFLGCDLVKHDELDHFAWTWYATVKARNQKTGLETLGASEQSFMSRDSNGTDTFARVKAISKAERNACKKQIPELEIIEMLKSVNPDRVNNLNVKPKPQPAVTTKTTTTTTDPVKMCKCTTKNLNNETLCCTNCGKRFEAKTLENLLRQQHNKRIDEEANKKSEVVN